MNKSKAISILDKVYHFDNVDRQSIHVDSGRIPYKTDFLTKEQHLILEKANLVPNNFEEFTHDSLLEGFLKIKNSEILTLDFCAALFIKGLSGEYPRYRQTLMSFWYLCEIDKHKFKKSKSKTNCSICNLPKHTVLDRTHCLLSYHRGHSWNEIPTKFLVELQDISSTTKPEISNTDLEHFTNLLREIAKAEPKETPGQLEKRIGKSKLLPKTDKYKRYGILQTLAVIGVLPSNPELDKQPFRSDIVLPLGGWKGSLGVDFDRVKEIFKISFE